MYSFGRLHGRLFLYASRLTPALLVRTDSEELEIFAGKKYLGSGIARPVPESRLVPRYVAFAPGEKISVKKTETEVSFSSISEPWLLFWYGSKSPFYRSAIPNLLWKMPPVVEFMKRGHFKPADIPVLVVLEQKPLKVKPTADSLLLTFGTRGAGTVVITPIFGFYHPPAEETERWRNDFPASLLRRIRIWARRLCAIPLACCEKVQVQPDGRVSIEQIFKYLEIRGERGTEPAPFAPFPPVVALARRYGFPVSFSQKASPCAIPTHSGPYPALEGSKQVRFTVGSLREFIRQKPSDRLQEDPAARALREELQEEIANILPAGRLAPACCLGAKSFFRMRFHFANPGELVLALSEALPYLQEEAKRKTVSYLSAFIEKNDPLHLRAVNNFEGTRREYFDLLPLDLMVKYLGERARRMGRSKITQETRADNVYSLWAFAEASGKWKLLRERWDDIKRTALRTFQAVDRPTCGFFRGPGEQRLSPAAFPGEDRGSVKAVNGLFARFVALARIADRFGDLKTAAEARYLLSRTSLLRFAQGKIVRYSYEEKFQAVEAPSDWMCRLSTATANGGGQAVLWKENWSGPDDDVRQVIRWDEFWPVISHAFGDHWYPVFPAFLDLTPECGRFLGRYLGEECRAFVRTVGDNCPAWFLTRGIAFAGKEKWINDPLNSYSIFLAHCYVLGTDGHRLLRCSSAR